MEVRSQSVVLQGYANVYERKSRLLRNIKGSFFEVVRDGIFEKALSKNKNVKMLLNHDKDHELASQENGTLEVRSDNVGLYVKAEISDPTVVDMAKAGRLFQWSFGFKCNDCDWINENGEEVRYLNDIDLFEVSILDDTRTSAYKSTSVTEIRSDDDGDLLVEYRSIDSEVEVEQVSQEDVEVDTEDVQEQVEVESETNNDEEIRHLEQKIKILKLKKGRL